MASNSGWYIGRIMISSVASVKGGSQSSVTDTVFYWSNASTAPTATSANITNLTAIVGGPYPTEAAAKIAAGKDPNTTTGVPGVGAKPPVSNSTVNSSNGNIPNPLAGLAAVGDFFQRLTQENTWIRIGETVLGILLIVSGLMSLSGAGGDLKDIVKLLPAAV